MNIADKYYMFHGKRPTKKRSFNFNPPKELLILGKAIAIEYQTDKLHGGGDGKRAVYRHEFETPAYVCMDASCKRQLYIVGEKIKVTEAGVEN